MPGFEMQNRPISKFVRYGYLGQAVERRSKKVEAAQAKSMSDRMPLKTSRFLPGEDNTNPSSGWIV
jgi:hypothetical protein